MFILRTTHGNVRLSSELAFSTACTTAHHSTAEHQKVGVAGANANARGGGNKATRPKANKAIRPTQKPTHPGLGA